jgi:hypothetical protein
MNSNFPQQPAETSYELNSENLYNKLSSEFIKSYTLYDYNKKKDLQTLIKK